MTHNNNLLLKKYTEYLIPTMVTTAALSLNEFIDSMLVSKLLGTQAMAVVNLGMPIMLLLAAVYTLLGNGGATVCAVMLGKGDSEQAGKIYRVSIMASLCCGVLVLAVGFISFKQLSALLCTDASLSGDFAQYLRVLLISSPFIVTILSFTEFMAPFGVPSLATAVNVTANGVNILMDYVYIRICGMGVEGAAWATLTGYGVGALLVVFMLIGRRIAIPKAKVSIADFKLLGEITSTGSSASASQLGFSLKFAFCNGLAAAYGGTAAVVAFSFCIQSLSIVSVFLAGILGSALPILAALHGQRDYNGEYSLLIISLISQEILSIVCFILFFFGTHLMTAAFSITDPNEVAVAVHALRIYSLMYIIRGVCIVFMKYLQAIGRKWYALFVSLFDGFAGIIPISWVMCRVMGIDGLWWAYPVTAVLLFVIILVWNRILSITNKGRYVGWLLHETDNGTRLVKNITVEQTDSGITEYSKQVRAFCIQNGMNEKNAVYTSLAIEEMAIYTRNRMSKQRYMDVILRLYDNPSHIEIIFRSLGASCSPLVEDESDIKENIKMLHGIAGQITYDYVMGMNNTRIIIN